jgi:2-hydroxy-3-keto-5-methylthiopentenyl-1-phosphate phosphatase
MAQTRTKHILIASDFDKTLSFNDSGKILAELLDCRDFDKKVSGLSKINIVQQGAELAYLLRHDPDFRCVRKDLMEQAGRMVQLKRNVKEFVNVLADGFPGFRFDFRVISAAPTVVVQAALEGLVPPEHIRGTDFDFDHQGEISAIRQASAGFGKVVILEELADELGVRRDHVVYVGDGSSDLHVMMHVNQHEGLTIGVSQTPYILRTAKRTVLSDNAMSVLVPVLEEIVGWNSLKIRDSFERVGLIVKEWQRARTDWLDIDDVPEEDIEPSTVVSS